VSPPLRKIVSGGQTGVDRAALDAALAAGLACGGWCPRGRRAEDGPLDPRYPLRETPDPDYAQRTRWNVRDAEATLILARGALRGGTALTRRCARTLGRPLWVADPDDPGAAAAIRAWLAEEAIERLNVAGPRESQQPGIYGSSRRLLEAVLERPRGAGGG
jgi:hypothetical protein